MSETSKITASHRSRAAVIYVRQSTLAQLERNTESTARQYDLTGRAASLGWPRDAIRVIDADLGVTGSVTGQRDGFESLVAEVGLGEVGIILALEASRLARDNAAWYRLLDLAGVCDTLVADADGVDHPGLFNDRLILGMKGIMAESELHVLRARLDGGIRNKAARGELRRGLPVGLVYGEDDGQVLRHPDEQVQAVIAAVFAQFEILGSARAVWLWLKDQGMTWPMQRTLCIPGKIPEITWVEPTYTAGAVAASAQRAYQALTPAQQESARQVFTQLTATSPDGTDTAIPAARADLTAGKNTTQARDVAAVLEQFTAERLLTLDTGNVRISHEVLLTAWPLLRDEWLARNRADRIIRTRLHATATEWDQSARDPAYLYSGTRLDAATTAARIAAGPRHIPLTQTDTDFLCASHQAARHRARTRQQLTAVLLTLVIALATAWIWIPTIRTGQAAAPQRLGAQSTPTAPAARSTQQGPPTSPAAEAETAGSLSVSLSPNSAAICLPLPSRSAPHRRSPAACAAPKPMHQH